MEIFITKYVFLSQKTKFSLEEHFQNKCMHIIKIYNLLLSLYAF